jgi:hypothetical protein
MLTCNDIQVVQSEPVYSLEVVLRLPLLVLLGR